MQIDSAPWLGMTKLHLGRMSSTAYFVTKLYPMYHVNVMLLVFSVSNFDVNELENFHLIGMTLVLTLYFARIKEWASQAEAFE